MEMKKIKNEIGELKKRLTNMEIRLTLANTWLRIWGKAYDALLYHGINFRTLPEYKDDKALDEAYTKPVEEGRNAVGKWLERLSNGIDAAIRRKGFKIH